MVNVYPVLTQEQANYVEALQQNRPLQGAGLSVPEGPVDARTMGDEQPNQVYTITLDGVLKGSISA